MGVYSNISPEEGESYENDGIMPFVDSRNLTMTPLYPELAMALASNRIAETVAVAGTCVDTLADASFSEGYQFLSNGPALNEINFVSTDSPHHDTFEPFGFELLPCDDNCEGDHTDTTDTEATFFEAFESAPAEGLSHFITEFNPFEAGEFTLNVSEVLHFQNSGSFSVSGSATRAGCSDDCGIAQDKSEVLSWANFSESMSSQKCQPRQPLKAKAPTRSRTERQKLNNSSPVTHNAETRQEIVKCEKSIHTDEFCLSGEDRAIILDTMAELKPPTPRWAKNIKWNCPGLINSVLKSK